MTDSDHTNDGIPAAHVLQLVDLVARWGVSAEELFAGIDVDVACLDDPLARVTIPALERIAIRAHDLTNEPALGIYLGMQMRVSAHGYLGFAAMTSSTVREALAIAIRFAPTRTSALALRLHIDGHVCALVIDERVPLGAARELVVLALIVGVEQIGRALTGTPLEGSADVTFARPNGFDHVDAFTGGRIRFGQPSNQVIFPAAVLDLPIALADPVARRLAQMQCERDLDAMRRGTDLGSRVRALVARDAGYRSLEDVARRLAMSPRTLKRRLADLGTGFSELVEEHRRERALMLLRSRELALDEIAARLGYSDVANFTRAFRRWTGSTPGAYRRTPRAR